MASGHYEDNRLGGCVWVRDYPDPDVEMERIQYNIDVDRFIADQMDLKQMAEYSDEFGEE